MLTVELRIKENGREMSFDRLTDELAMKLARALKKQIAARKNKDMSAAYAPGSHGRSSPAPAPDGEGERLTPKVVGINEAARLLGIRPSTLRVLVRQERIRIVRIGRRVLVPMESIEKVVREGIPGRGSFGST